MPAAKRVSFPFLLDVIGYVIVLGQDSRGNNSDLLHVPAHVREYTRPPADHPACL